jgi:hypothetical protein
MSRWEASDTDFPEGQIDLRSFVEELAEHIAAFLAFAFAALPAHITALPKDNWDYIDE